MTVFSGPVFGEFDRLYGHARRHGPYLLPEAFWKVVVLRRADGRLSATAYRLAQTQLIDPLFERNQFQGFDPFTVAEAGTFQTTIEKIERETRLDFAGLKQNDPLVGLEGTEVVRPIRDARDLVV